MLHAAAAGLLLALALALPAWVASVVRRDASLADRVWSLLVAAPAALYAAWWRPPLPPQSPASWLLALLGAWALRLAWHITRRNRGHGEDRRYAAMRRRSGPRFAWTSAITVFGLQAVLAWAVGWPLLAALAAAAQGAAHPALACAGALLAAAGLAFEAVADRQLARFTADPSQRGRVMDRGLWRWSRHPNYFGECCFWWGAFCMALGIAGTVGAWSIASPLLMTWLLLRVSGVRLLEQDIAERRPGYRAYAARTSAFVPWPPRRGPAGRHA